MPPSDFHVRMNQLIDSGRTIVVVTLVDTHGSTPADAGSKMLVDADGREFGTVGGGRIEARAIEEAKSLISSHESNRFVDWSLQSDIGMTCGGRVRLFFEAWNQDPWRIAIFGAGHVTQALAKLLATLPCRVTCIDPRDDWLGQLPTGVQSICVQEPSEHVRELTDDTYVLCMTRGHRSDFPVLRQIYQDGRDFPYIGVIGSRAKAAVLRKELVENGIHEDAIKFHCPVGLPIGSNHPAEIAVSIAAQLIQERDRAAADTQAQR
ncbi:MAG: xanthine dehydrogenase accessory protein XdhC [Pirellulaceae bacterium]|nr:xanthine dehydrogenase accessory protein XdhC [Pirellulaceae bacterium]